MEPMLEAMFHDLNRRHFDNALPLPRLAWNTRLSTTAGRFSPRGWPKIKATHSEALIEVAGYLRELPDGEMHIRDTVLHEMIHYWLWVRRRPYGHTKEFHAKMRATGAKRWNPVPKQRPPRYIYACRNCQTEIPARRKQPGDIACYQCCKRYNGGHFHPKFRLFMKSDLRDAKEQAWESGPDEFLFRTNNQAKPTRDMSDDLNQSAQPSANAVPPINKEEKITPFNEVVRRLQNLRELVQSKKIRY